MTIAKVAAIETVKIASWEFNKPPDNYADTARTTRPHNRGYGVYGSGKVALSHATDKFSELVSRNREKIDRKQTRLLEKTKERSKETPSIPPSKYQTSEVDDSLALLRFTMQQKDEKEFWEEAVQKMTRWTMRKNLIELNFPGGKHAVASCENGGVYYFFDPNGGIMAFKEDDDAANWLRKEFRKADADKYDKINVVTVYDYERTVRVENGRILKDTKE